MTVTQVSTSGSSIKMTCPSNAATEPNPSAPNQTAAVELKQSCICVNRITEALV